MSSLLTAKELLRPYLRWAYYSWFPQQRTSYFVDCWKYPSYKCDDKAVVKLPAALSGSGDFDILFFPMNDWHSRMQRSQQLAKAFAAQNHRVVYVNPHLGCEYWKPYWADRHSRISILGLRLLELHVHLQREHPFHRRMLTAGEDRAVISAARTLVGSLGSRSALQIVSFPVWARTVDTLRREYGFPIVYDCHDLIDGFRNVAQEIKDSEAHLMRLSDVVVFSSEHLRNMAIAKYPEVASRSVLVRNGADWSHFRKLRATRRKAGTVIGYMGSLDHWFNVEAVRRAALDHPSWKFVLIGRVEDGRVNALRAYSNIEMVGEVPYADLPSYVVHFDAAMIPFERDELTLATNPIKLYEYFSLGVPVVTTRLPETEIYDELLYIADNPREFSAQLTRALKENSPALRQRRMALAKSENWGARATEVLECVRHWHLLNVSPSSKFPQAQLWPEQDAPVPVAQ